MGRVSHTAAMSAASATLAARQHGVAARNQLHALGLSEDQIDGWVRAGRLRRVFRGVYAVGRPSLTEKGRLQAAVLACEPGAVISHRSAACLLRIGERSPLVIDLISPSQNGRAIDGIKVHHVSYPAPTEMQGIHGLPARPWRGRPSTSPAPTAKRDCAKRSRWRRCGSPSTWPRSTPSWPTGRNGAGRPACAGSSTSGGRLPTAKTRRSAAFRGEAAAPGRPPLAR